MILNDIYKTIENKSEGIFKEKRSKFLAFAYPVMSEDAVKEHLQKLKQAYYDANHHCYACRFGLSGSQFRIDDNGEPSGTAGKPILGQIKSRELTNILIVVIRYFGGIKLGTSGLIKAYKAAAAEAIENASIVEKTVNNFYEISFSYSAMNDVMRVLKDENPEISNQQFNLNCVVQFSMRLSKSSDLISKLEKIETVKSEFLYSQ
jgi:uncharacterized YigZ family protein